MIYTPLTIKAINLAYNAHLGQTDPGGVPYILHPIHLAEQMDDEISVCIALLHDVVEDTDITLHDLSLQFPDVVVQAVRLLTHNAYDTYPDYLRRIKANPYAKKVKIADILHNSDQTRLSAASMPQEKLNLWKIKYQNALDFLTNKD